MYTVGEKIAEFRKNKKMTQEELAAIVGVSAQSVSKWENSQTMPDVMLLPTLAAALEVTVNDFYSIVSAADHFEAIPPDKTPEHAYKELFKALQQGLCDQASLSKEEVSGILERLRSGSYGQSGLVSYENNEMNGGTYVNASIGLSFIKPKSDALSLLENEKIAEILLILSNRDVRRVLKYMLTNGNATVTAAVAAKKCGIPANDAETALNKLFTLNMVQMQSVETGEDRPLNVYHLFGEYKMFMAFFPLLELARTVAEWHNGWIGFRC